MQARKPYHAAIHAQETPYSELVKLIEAGWDPNSNARGYNGLHAAVDFPIHEMKRRFTLLLEHGVDVNVIEQKDRYSCTVLHKLVVSGNQEKLRHFLSEAKRCHHRVDFNITMDKETPLITALKCRNAQTVATLFEFGGDTINIEIADSSGSTALFSACIFAMTETILFLISRGANVHHVALDGKTPLDVLETVSNSKVYLELVGINPDRDEFAKSNIIKDKNGLCLYTYDKREKRMIAHDSLLARKESRVIVEELLKGDVFNSDVEPQEKDAKMVRGLGLVLSPQEKKEVLKQFDVMSGVTVEEACKREKSNIYAALFALQIAHPALIRHCIIETDINQLKIQLARNEMKPYLDTLDPYTGDRPLHMTVGFGDMAMTMALIEAGADIHLTNQAGKSPMVFAAEERQYGCMLVFATRASCDMLRDVFKVLREQNEIAVINLIAMILGSENITEKPLTLQSHASLFNMDLSRQQAGNKTACKPVTRVKKIAL